MRGDANKYIPEWNKYIPEIMSKLKNAKEEEAFSISIDISRFEEIGDREVTGFQNFHFLIDNGISEKVNGKAYARDLGDALESNSKFRFFAKNKRIAIDYNRKESKLYMDYVKKD